MTTSAGHFSPAELAAGLRYFTAAELSRHRPIPEEYRANARAVLVWLDQVRAVLGVPVVITSLYRSPAYNRDIGGSPTSQHMRAAAVDFVVRGLTHEQIAARLFDAERRGDVPAYRQWIQYPWTAGHVHAGMGTGRGKLVELPGGGRYAPLTSPATAGLARTEAAALRNGFASLLLVWGLVVAAIILFLALTP